MRRDPVQEKQWLEAAQEIWQEKWANQHTDWQQPERYNGVLALGDTVEEGTAVLFHQVSKEGDKARLFAVKDGTSESFAVEYLVEQRLQKSDPDGLLASALQDGYASMGVIIHDLARSAHYIHARELKAKEPQGAHSGRIQRESQTKQQFGR